MDTGRAGVIGSAARDWSLGKKFFKANGILPAVPVREDLHIFPAPDFTNLNGGSMSRSEGVADYTVGNPGNFGWDMGSLKSEVLIIASQRTRQTSMGLFLSSALPSAGDPPNGSYIFIFGQSGSGGVEIYKRASGSYTSLGGNTKYVQDFSNSQGVPGVAFYYKDSSDVLKVFIRFGNEDWGKAFEITDSSFTTMRYAGIFATNGGGGVGDHFRSYCPIGIYADA
jgi:hypothetical protein